MYYLDCGQHHNNSRCYKNDRVIGTIPPGLWIVKRGEKFHDLFFRSLGYKIDLPFLVINTKMGNKGEKTPC